MLHRVFSRKLAALIVLTSPALAVASELIDKPEARHISERQLRLESKHADTADGRSHLLADLQHEEKLYRLQEISEAEEIKRLERPEHWESTKHASRLQSARTLRAFYKAKAEQFAVRAAKYASPE